MSRSAAAAGFTPSERLHGDVAEAVAAGEARRAKRRRSRESRQEATSEESVPAVPSWCRCKARSPRPCLCEGPNLWERAFHVEENDSWDEL